MEILLNKGNDFYDITEYTNNINLSTSMGTLGASLSFNLARNYKDKNFAISERLEVGDIIVLKNTKVLFTGIILSKTTNRFQMNIKCLDYSFYLNKNKILKQFEEISASTAIIQTLKEINAPIGDIAPISTSISKIYNGNTVAEIINDILTQVNNELGVKYIIEFQDMKFNIVPFKKIEVDFKFNETSDESLTESILEMKNKIVVTSNEQEDTEILAIAQDENNIVKYGSLQEVIQVDPDEDVSKVRNIANTKLKELNKVFRTASIKGFGNDDFRAGRVIRLNKREFGLIGLYLILNCTHTWVKGTHLVSLEVEEYAE